MTVARVIAFALLVAVLAAAAVTDWRTGKVRNRLTFPAILAGLLLWTIAGGVAGGTAGAIDGLTRSGLAMLAGLVPYAVVFAAGGIGAGDVKLMAAVGALSASWECVLGTSVIGFALLAVSAVVVMIRRRIVRRTLHRLLSVAFQAASKAKAEVPGAGDSPRLPVAAAMAVGGVIAGVEYVLGVRMPWG